MYEIYSDEWEVDSDDEYDEMFGEFEYDDEDELAAELLSVDDEEELEQFLGSILSGAWQGAKRLYHSPIGQAARRGAVGLAKQYLPQAGQYLGSKAGGYLGQRAGQWAAGRIGDALSPEMELEAAKQLIRAVKAAGKQIAKAPVAAPPKKVAKEAYFRAARRYPPLGMSRRRHHHYPRSPYSRVVRGLPMGGYSGRWFRRGGNIVLVGA